MLQKIYDSFLTLAYPQACQICQNSVETFDLGAACRDCWQNTRVFSGAETLCGKCSAYLQANSSNHETFCHACDEHFYDASRAVGLYENALTASVLHLKREPFVSERLKKLFLAAFKNSPFQQVTAIIPVPLSKKRFLERGFNQAEILAKILSQETGLKMDGQSLARKVHTPMHRAGMDKRARELTVADAFTVTRPNLIKNQTILLIDDVFTSGATVSYCAKALKKHGAGKVYVLTIARAF